MAGSWSHRRKVTGVTPARRLTSRAHPPRVTNRRAGSGIRRPRAATPGCEVAIAAGPRSRPPLAGAMTTVELSGYLGRRRDDEGTTVSRGSAVRAAAIPPDEGDPCRIHRSSRGKAMTRMASPRTRMASRCRRPTSPGQGNRRSRSRRYLRTRLPRRRPARPPASDSHRSANHQHSGGSQHSGNHRRSASRPRSDNPRLPSTQGNPFRVNRSLRRPCLVSHIPAGSRCRGHRHLVSRTPDSRSPDSHFPVSRSPSHPSPATAGSRLLAACSS